MRFICVMTAVAAMMTLAQTRAIGADAADGGKGKQLNHVVLIKFKAAATEAQIKEVTTAFAALKEKVPGVTSLKWGTNVSPEKKNKGYSHAFALSFASDKDRDVYLTHPAHQAFGKVLGPVLDDVLVIDFWNE